MPLDQYNYPNRDDKIANTKANKRIVTELRGIIVNMQKKFKIGNNITRIESFESSTKV